ncbi:hypothetical protein TIFTF001_030698 [Ficus carica]|uniref:Uncharacterized protein n=1 Tax=Ficus carica TaxID=3494 RepID=A0AA88DTK5_FICCA|nr:hypothetical protein TIFTF001_030698 [Ficus carica]
MEVTLLFFKEKIVTALMGTPGERGGGDSGGGKKPGLWRRFGKSFKWRRRRRRARPPRWARPPPPAEGGGEENSLSCLEG